MHLTREMRKLIQPVGLRGLRIRAVEGLLVRRASELCTQCVAPSCVALEGLGRTRGSRRRDWPFSPVSVLELDIHFLFCPRAGFTPPPPYSLVIDTDQITPALQGPARRATPGTSQPPGLRENSLTISLSLSRARTHAHTNTHDVLLLFPWRILLIQESTVEEEARGKFFLRGK